jgi:N-acyl-D-amino-acid deacylase
MDYTIQHSTVIDGTGAARFAADVLIRDGRIAEVAPHVPTVGEVIDARGMIVCPGFIDMHTHSQLVVFTEPDLPMKAAQGITTELFGQDGMATFPMVPQASAMWRTHLSGLDCNPPIDWDWQDAEQYLQRLPHPSVNIATLEAMATCGSVSWVWMTVRRQMTNSIVWACCWSNHWPRVPSVCPPA